MGNKNYSIEQQTTPPEKHKTSTKPKAQKKQQHDKM